MAVQMTASSCGSQCAQGWVDDDRAEPPNPVPMARGTATSLRSGRDPRRATWTGLHRVVAFTSSVGSGTRGRCSHHPHPLPGAPIGGLLSAAYPRRGDLGYRTAATGSEAEQPPTWGPAGPRPSTAAHPMARYLFPRLATGSPLLLPASTFRRGSLLGPALSLGGAPSLCGWLVLVLSRPRSTL